ncbi:hypothetical protein PoB_000888200 [Plakobranchus ocellatus]|uniref:Lysosome-associated membrane glycoprotein 5 n=1 Tax=Plakobranchus ocellatus TaxID=259542 RepID=A0AAV3YJ25_9GAST|nr:hypothetical protein PoB_000888200 [Plakobranchus ocellatus]
MLRGIVREKSAPANVSQPSPSPAAVSANVSHPSQNSTEVPTNISQPSESDTDVLANVSHILVVRSRTGQPCLLAALNATIQISYKVLEGIVHERYVSTEDIQLPEDVRAEGVCGTNQSQLLLDWGNGTFHLNLTFSLQEPSSPSLNSTWSLTAISVSYDLSNSLVFPAASEATLVTAERSDLSLFTTEVGQTYSCQRDVTVQVGTEDEGIDVNFHNVLLAAFGVTSTDFPNEINTCAEKDSSEDSEDILIPLIVACCLSAIVIIIVIGYVISRIIQRKKEQSDYRAM